MRLFNICALLVLISSCGADPKSEPVASGELGEKTAEVPAVAAQENVTGTEYPQTLYIDALVDLPPCGEGNYRQLIYVAEDGGFRSCRGSGWSVVEIGATVVETLPGEKTIEQQEVRTETVIVENTEVVVEKPVIVEKIVIQEKLVTTTVTVNVPGETVYTPVEITPEMPKFRYTHAAINEPDNKFGALDYWLYSARIIDLGNGGVFVWFSGFGNGDGMFSHVRLMSIGGSGDFYFPGNAGAPVLKATVLSLTSLKLERTQSDMAGTETTFTLIAE